MSRTLSLIQHVAKLQQELTAMENQIAGMVDQVEAIALTLEEGVEAVLPGLDLSMVPTIRLVLCDLPSEIRRDPRSACYFDQLDRILAALS